MKKHYAILLIVVGGLAIEALLITRIWAQASSQPIDSDLAEGLFSVTDGLASLFSPLTGKEPLHETGVIDYAVLLAAEVYFVAMLVLVAVVLIATGGWSLFGRLRKKELPDFVRAQMSDFRRRGHWQPMRTSRVVGLRYYVPLKRHEEAPPHIKSGLGGL